MKVSDDKKPASLESSKGFHRGSKSFLKAFRHPYPEKHENPSTSMKIYQNQWKSIESHENQWNTMKVLR